MARRRIARIRHYNGAMARSAIVIGGTRRVGRWASEALLVAGCRVQAVFRQDSAGAQAFAAEMAQGGYALGLHRADVTDELQARDALAAAAEAAGGLDTLIYCPGAALRGAVMTAGGAELERIWRSNVLGAHHCITAAVPYLRMSHEDDNGGRIVLFSSAGADSAKAFRDVPLYAACKAMLHSYARSLARELAGSGVTVNCLALGVTELKAEGAPEIDPAGLPSGVAVGQEDIAAALWYLLGSGSAQVTGTVVNIGGGFGL
jgi:NAD(P)-dependent dehydrogenase (short-subunit alcohol dehydrogenase family)